MQPWTRWGPTLMQQCCWNTWAQPQRGCARPLWRRSCRSITEGGPPAVHLLLYVRETDVAPTSASAPAVGRTCDTPTNSRLSYALDPPVFCRRLERTASLPLGAAAGIQGSVGWSLRALSAPSSAGEAPSVGSCATRGPRTPRRRSTVSLPTDLEVGQPSHDCLLCSPARLISGARFACREAGHAYHITRSCLTSGS